MTSIGLALHDSDMAKGAVSDKQIMMDNIKTHKALTKKSDSRITMEDLGTEDHSNQ